MSKRINVNPDHYKVAGRERQGEDIVHGLQKSAYAEQQAHAERWQSRRRREVPEPAAEEKARQILVERPPSKKSARVAVSGGKAKSKAKSKGALASKGRPAAKRGAPASRTSAPAKRRKS